MHLIDLHIHSTYSRDSDLKIEDILKYCLGFEKATIAVADHNNLRSIEELSLLAADKRYKNIRCIPSVELSALLGGERVHLLYYFKDSAMINPSLREYLDHRYSEGMRIDIEEALRFKDGNMIISLAHPRLSLDKIGYLKAKGVDALEIFNPKLSMEEMTKNLEHAVMLDMPITSGSDSHGSKTPDRAIGRYNSHFLDISYAGRFLRLLE